MIKYTKRNCKRKGCIIGYLPPPYCDNDPMTIKEIIDLQECDRENVEYYKFCAHCGRKIDEEYLMLEML
jgi:hypothetical protein